MRDIIKWFHAHFILGVLVEEVDCREAHTLACNVLNLPFDCVGILRVESCSQSSPFSSVSSQGFQSGIESPKL